MITDHKLTEVCERLNNNRVKYVLIGGCAMVLHGYERTTQDIDILVEVSAKNIVSLKKALADILPLACQELASDDVAENTVVRMVGDDLILDLIGNIGDVDFVTASKNIIIEKINDVEIPVADVETMIELKKGVRDMDKRDYMFLKGKKDYLDKLKK